MDTARQDKDKETEEVTSDVGERGGGEGLLPTSCSLHALMAAAVAVTGGSTRLPSQKHHPPHPSPTLPTPHLHHQQLTQPQPQQQQEQQQQEQRQQEEEEGEEEEGKKGEGGGQTDGFLSSLSTRRGKGKGKEKDGKKKGRKDRSGSEAASHLMLLSMAGASRDEADVKEDG